MNKSLILILVLVAALGGCAGFSGGRDKEPAKLPIEGKIAVLPMDRASIRPGQERATCALSDKVFDAEEISPEVADQVTTILFKSVSKDSRFITVPETKCVGFLSALLRADVKASQIRLIQSLGQQLGVQGVLYAKLFRFDDRVGGRYAIRKPASVAFTIHLIRTSDGAILWRSTFDETQQSLSENLLNVGMYKETGMRWLTAAELASYGINRAIKDLLPRLPQ